MPATPSTPGRSDPFGIHELAVGGGTLGIAPLPGLAGDLAGDMARIADWAPALVLCLVTREELALCGSRDPGRDMQQAGFLWRHRPIRDFGAPEAGFERTWPATAQEALRLMAEGRRVLVHCRGGCGRSGMVALRLMIEAGEAPGPALLRLRETRPCAVETEGQRAWACAGLPRDPSGC